METVCFTGHRPNKLYGYKDRTAYQPLLDVLKTCVKHLYESGVTDFITGGAQGFDQLSFWAVHVLKKQLLFETNIDSQIRNKVYIPFEQQPSRWSKEGVFSQSDYYKMLAVADEIINISEMRRINTQDKRGTIQALFARNEAMVDISDAVIGLYSHAMDFRNDSGGTAGCLKYAYNQKKRILLIDPHSMRLKQVA